MRGLLASTEREDGQVGDEVIIGKTVRVVAERLKDQSGGAFVSEGLAGVDVGLSNLTTFDVVEHPSSVAA